MNKLKKIFITVAGLIAAILLFKPFVDDILDDPDIMLMLVIVFLVAIYLYFRDRDNRELKK